MKSIKELATQPHKSISKKETKLELAKLKKKLFVLQNLFYAERKHSLLIIFQGMDTSGKDGTIRHVFSCINPQGCNVKSFKAPTELEKQHDYLWRIYPHLPAKGMMQIFNRSQYEDILYPEVHQLIDKKEVQRRFATLNNLETHLQSNQTIVLKFFLNISKEEQSKRLKERAENPDKNWKSNPSDLIESEKWNKYTQAYQHIFEEASKDAQWMIIPSDKKWYRNYLVAKKMVDVLVQLNMHYPNLKEME